MRLYTKIKKTRNHGSTESRNHRITKSLVFLCFCVSVFLFALPAFAQLDTGLTQVGDASGLATTDIRTIVGNGIRIFLGLLGVIAVVLILYGGYLWMTAAGNEEKVEKAKKILTNAVIGLVIILSAYAIVAFIIGRFLGATGGVGESASTDGRGDGGGGRLGTSIVESHYPVRNATGIPRNTKIVVTFKEPILRASVINDQGTADLSDDIVQAKQVRLRKKAIVRTPSENDFLTNVRVSATPDGKTFVFAPQTLLGSPSEPIAYLVRLESGIKKANGDSAFGFGKGYEWSFEVSTVIDTTPPTVTSVLPAQGETYPRNVVVQATFSEAIDPTVVVGDQTLSKVAVRDAQGKGIHGIVAIANQYQTMEFVTDNLCGKNSCGGDVFCLPANTPVTVTLPSAQLTTEATDDPFSAALPYTGIVDLAGNALDGNEKKDTAGKRVADGPGAPPEKDDFVWSFSTNDTIDLTPPIIVATTPVVSAGRIPLDADVKATFSKPLMASTFTTANVVLDPPINFWTAMETDKGRGVGIIRHDPFLPQTVYAPTITAGVKDLFQNCYFPCAGLSCAGKSWQGYPSCSLP